MRRPPGARPQDRAIDTGLMASGTDVKYHLGPDGTVFPVALGRSGQVLASGERLISADQSRTVSTPRRLGGEPLFAFP
ncbi:hypothetical protein [Streptomyces lushanensis]|uniref:hypothetical protein n=1 Tax=Streptomyces lushanensis TaxID=1434255 RepID=UPI0008377620|nr:hypothetical protein [Streptomyces lushanensis]